MSDTGDDSDDSSSQRLLNYRRGSNNNNNNKRKIVMKIEFDDSDETSSSNSDVVENISDNDPIKPSCSNGKRRRKSHKGKLLVSSSDDYDSSSDSEIMKGRVAVKGNKLRKPIIIDDDKEKSPISDKTKEMNSTTTNIDENGFTTDGSSDETLEKCPICLLSLRNQEIGTPETCDHVFCAICIEEWSKNVRTCPIDRREFESILVRDSFITKKFVRKINIDEKNLNATVRTSASETIDVENDVTFCEICGQSNREDIMLLCDGCNQGYHMDCLIPQLDEIPDGFWYCDDCFESDEDEDINEQLDSLYNDLREMGVPETRFRIREFHQPRILRTRQSERIRANILARTTSILRDVPSTSSSSSRARQIESTTSIREVPSTSSSSSRARQIESTSSMRQNRKSSVKRKRRRTRRKRRTYVVEYDVNNYDEKFALKTTKKYVRKRRSRKRKSRRSCRAAQNVGISAGNRSRLAAALGLVQNEAEQNEMIPVKQFRSNFSIFGNPNQLDYFSDESDDDDNIGNIIEHGSGGGRGGLGTAIQTSARLRSVNSLMRWKGTIQDIQPPIQQSNTVDILSSIMELQDRWHNATQRMNSVRIEPDGTLNIEETQRSNSNRNSSQMSKPEENRNNQNVNNEINPNNIVNAPLYPRGGNQNFSVGGGGTGGGGASGNSGNSGAGNYNNRYNNQSNYRNSSGNNTGPYNNRNSTGGFGFSFNSFRRDNNFQQDNSFLSNPANNTPNNRNRFNRNQNQNQNQTQNQNQNQNQRFGQRNLLPFAGLRNFNTSLGAQNTSTDLRTSINENLVSIPPQIHPQIQIRPIQSLQQQSLQQQPPPPPPPPLQSIPSLQHMQSVPPPLANVRPPLQQFNKPCDTTVKPPNSGSVGDSLNFSLNVNNAANSNNNINISNNTVGHIGPVFGPMPLINQNQNKVNASSTVVAETKNTTAVVPPLAPPPWNNNLFRLTDDYGGDDDDDDDDSNCPNFSVYSAESFQVARSSDTEKEAAKESNKVQQEDEYDEKEEDLVQLGDDDDIPATIDDNIIKHSNNSDIYEPENPTEENDYDYGNDKNEIASNDKREEKESGINTNNVDNSEKNNDEIKHDEGSKMDTTTTDEIKNQNKNVDCDRENNDDDDTHDKTEEKVENVSNELMNKSKEGESSSSQQIHNKSDNEKDNDKINLNVIKAIQQQLQHKHQRQPINIAPKKIEFKLKKRGILELYDDSDWEEWNIEKPLIGPKTLEETERSYTPVESNKSVKKDNEEKTEDVVENVESNQTVDSVSEVEEPDRSYTPCLDEKTDDQDINETPEKEDDDEPRTPELVNRTEKENEKNECEKIEVSTTVIDGMETELISEGEDEEILNEAQNVENKKKEKDASKKEKEENIKKVKKEQFKKISKNTKERNYRGEKERERPKPRSRSRSRSRNRNRRDFNKFDRKKIKRKEIERYNVRNVINQPRTYKDRYGRDTSRPPRSRTRSRSRSHRRRSRTRSRTISQSHSRSRSFSSRRNHSFSISPTPESFGRISQRRRRSFSPRRSRSPRRRSRSPIRRLPIRRRSRSPLPRIRSRSNSRIRMNNKRPPPRRRSISLSSPSLSRSRTKSRSRSRSKSRSRSRSNLKIRPLSPKKSRSHSMSPIKRKQKRSKDRKKKKLKKRPRSITPSPPPSRHSHQSRPIDRSTIMKKKKKRTRTKSPLEEPMTWSPSPPPPIESVPGMPGNDASWTPPLLSPNHPPSLRVVLNNNKENISASKKKREKKKKIEKRRDPAVRKEKRKRRSEIPESPVAPSKEVFASGDNILVSVSFNKEGNIPPQQQTTVVTLPPTREEIITKRRTPERPKKQKKVREKSQRRHKKTDAKPVAIIDLDRSPFQEIIQSPRDIIVLTDSDHETENRHANIDNHNNHNNRMEIQSMEHNAEEEHMRPLNTSDQNMSNHHEENIPEEPFELQQLGPKTPPEPPVIKFSLPVKNKQVKGRNPLHDEQEEIEDQPQEHEEHEHEMEMQIQNTNKIGPNTPPESGPCSPDAYDPFDPTKSPSASPSPPPPAEMTSSIPESIEHHPPEEPRTATVLTQDKNINPVELVMALMSSKTKQVQEATNTNQESQFTISGTGDLCESHEKLEDNSMSKQITVVSNVLITPGKSHRPSSNIPTIASPVSKTPQTIGNLGSQSIISKLPLPKIGSNSRQNGGGSSSGIGGIDDNIMNEIESPYSPGSEDYEDLFEPPPNDNSISLAQLSSRPRAIKSSNNSGTGGTTGVSGGGAGGNNNKNNKIEVFDNLFGSISPVLGQVRLPSYTASTVRKQRNSNSNKTHKKSAIKVSKMGTNDDQNKAFDELPNSAVELQVKDKFLRKLYRQERVVDEVKLVLKPHYIKKHISKEDYKEILRRAVPKICHSRSGEINPKKIQNLIEAYVKKFRQRNKLGIGIATGQVSSAVKCAAYLKKL